ncbi:hypothetical protein [Streptomyces sp. NPDC020607]|uniref:hypothetical protein n=1 Tax=Streptomyces sp. NPDC020607 TaxID=3365082 RepID=UPI0037ACBC3B
MPRDLITSLEVQTVTHSTPGSGTDGYVYLGIGGREFVLDKPNDTHQPSPDGTPESFVFGEGSNVENPRDNDPRSPQLTTDDLDVFPAYLRFKPKDDQDDWRVADVQVTATGSGEGGPRYYDYNALTGKGGLRASLRLGDKFGNVLHLSSVWDDPTQSW